MTVSDNKIWKWVLFMIWPFASFLYAIRNFKYKSYRPVILAFFVLYGYTMIFNDSGTDANKHAKQFVEVAQKPFSELFVVLRDFISRSTGDLDLYKPLSNFIVSRFTDKPQWVFALHAFVFGFFYLKSMEKLYDEFGGTFNKNSRIFFIFFVTLFPIVEINGVRMWTAVWVFFYGMANLFYGGSKKYLFLCLSAGLIHFSLFTVNIVFLIFYFLGNKNYIYIPILIISFFMPNLLSSRVNDVSSELGEGYEQRTSAYTNEFVAQAKKEAIQQTKWFVRYRGQIITYYFLTAFILTIINRRRFIQDQIQRNLGSFLILFLSFVNLGSNILSLGSRLRSMFFLFSIFYFYRLYQLNPSKGIKLVPLLAIFPILVWAGVEFRTGAELMGAFLFISNPIAMMLTEPTITVYHVLFER